MASTPLAWGPREGKILCTIELDLSPDIECASYQLDAILRMCIDFCSASVWKERRSLDPQPPSGKMLTDFETFQELFKYWKGQREEAETNPWIPAVEVIPPTTLFTDCKHAGIKINLGLPQEIALEVRLQFEQKWQELMTDIKLCGVGPFLELYRKPSGDFGGGPPFKAEYPLDRWGPLMTNSGLICVKKSESRGLGS